MASLKSMTSRYARRKDDNQSEIVAHLRKLGATVQIVSHIAGLGFDIIVAYGDVVRFVEIKDGSKPPSERQLSDNEKAAEARWPSLYRIIIDEATATELFKEMRHG